MANRITGSTDTSGALTVTQRVPKSVILVGAKESGVATTAEEIFTIYGTADAASKFGDASPFVEMVRILITNGVSYIKGIILGTVGASQDYADLASAYEGAFAKTLVDDSIKGILLGSHEAAVIAKLKAHLASAEQEDLYRYSVIGGADGATNDALITLAESINHKRIFVVGPNVIDSSNTEKSSIYTATALMSLIMTETNDPALPMNGVQVLGYNGTTRVLLKSEKDTLADGGVVALYPSGGLATVHRLVTSYTEDSEGEDDPIWHEGTTAFIADDVLESVITRLRTNYKRTKNVARVLDAIRTDVIDVLNIKNGLEIIQNFDKNTVTVTKDPEDLYGALVDYEFTVVTPLYTITISQHMKI